MIRFMLDSDTPEVLRPGWAHVYGLYSDLVPDLGAQAARLAPGRVVLIDRGLGDPSGRSQIIDVEKGTHGPDQAPGWFDRQKAHGLGGLTTYCNRSTMPAVDAAMGGRGFSRWIATLDGTAHIDGHAPLEGPAVIQCFTADMLGIHADGSLIFEDAWHPLAGALVALETIARDLRNNLGDAARQAADLCQQLAEHAAAS